MLAPELKENNATLQTVSLSKLWNYSETQEGTVGVLTALCPNLNSLLHIHKEYWAGITVNITWCLCQQLVMTLMCAAIITM